MMWLYLVWWCFYDTTRSHPTKLFQPPSPSLAIIHTRTRMRRCEVSQKKEFERRYQNNLTRRAWRAKRWVLVLFSVSYGAIKDVRLEQPWHWSRRTRYWWDGRMRSLLLLKLSRHVITERKQIPFMIPRGRWKSHRQTTLDSLEQWKTKTRSNAGRMVSKIRCRKFSTSIPQEYIDK